MNASDLTLSYDKLGYHRIVLSIVICLGTVTKHIFMWLALTFGCKAEHNECCNHITHISRGCRDLRLTLRNVAT